MKAQRTLTEETIQRAWERAGMRRAPVDPKVASWATRVALLIRAITKPPQTVSPERVPDELIAAF